MPDISRRPTARSTSTAWMFTATSIEPSAAPKAISAAASPAGVPAIAKKATPA
jgi:hypothetical protein